MGKTLSISFRLKNTYLVNTILFSLKQIPLVKRLLPDTLYSVGGLKVFAHVIAIIWEVIMAFAGKFMYILLFVFALSGLYFHVPHGSAFVHVLFFLTLIGSYTNTYIFDPSKDKYYAMFLLRMNAKAYTLVNYAYALVKVFVGFMIFGMIFGHLAEVPIWMCLLIPFFVVGIKVFLVAMNLRKYERTGKAPNENTFGKGSFIVTFVLLIAAYGLPIFGFVLPTVVAVILMVGGVVLGILSIQKILSFTDYRLTYQMSFNQNQVTLKNTKEATVKQSRNFITDNVTVKSNAKGFEYLNELFVKRHQKLLWTPTKVVTYISICVIGCLIGGCLIIPQMSGHLNQFMMTNLPLFVLIMYFINRGTGFTQALFINCDHSLLTYSFYKQPKAVLKMFEIRLRSIMKINLVPACVIGVGMAVLLYITGGTDHPLNYLVWIISIPVLSMFFLVHYLTMYYLLQPYTAGTELKGGTYKIVMTATYILCFAIYRLQVSTMMFGILTIGICVIYCIVACILAYFIAPKTFKLRM